MTPDAYDSTPPRGSEPPYDRVYRPRARMAHLRADHSICCDPLDSKWSPDPDTWRGTGNQEEYERAAALPLCTQCFAWRETAQFGIDRDQTDPAERNRRAS